MTATTLELWKAGKLLRQAFEEHVTCVRRIHELAEDVLQVPEDTPAEFYAQLGEVPPALYTVRRNLFSTLFYSSYLLLDVQRERRLLYGKLNQLFRIWVTNADNLLDDEDKTVLPIEMPGNSRIMRQVVSIMAADRILKRVLDDAVVDGTITPGQSASLAKRSLQVLLPSAAQEASEEGGVTTRPKPEYVLSTIHRLKTGILFHIPFLGPEVVETEIDAVKMAALKDAFMKFGVGCQILDDIRDMAKDCRERRHNYILSTLYWERRSDLDGLEERELALDERIYGEFPGVVLPAARLGLRYLREALGSLAELGLGIQHHATEKMAASMLTVLDLGDLEYA